MQRLRGSAAENADRAYPMLEIWRKLLRLKNTALETLRRLSLSRAKGNRGLKKSA